jgi:aldehyde:ferredoxin oxidoreductase
MGKAYSLGGKILNVNLSSREVQEEPTASYSERFLGGLGISLWVFLHEMARGWLPSIRRI